ncbi:30S ribosome-binding factor RbfA [Atopococcus tabaci]|uniref:30S ribosome-binding factor RbfA n=1 Tax=Atopococcus tabaci TaxID=269774 RepID=UPI002409400A|nr:30S ribosome-binding factor RbfA [Atopococcus tabaci]
MPNYRVGRVAQEIQREVNDILRKRVRDPRVEGVTITEVDVTGDLQQATVLYSTLSEEPETIEDTQKGLEKATGLIRKELGSRLTLYRTPELTFQRDESLAYGNRIEELLNQIKQEDEEE